MDNNSNTLRHHGILGQRWGIRRFQNRDGSLTAAGRKRRGTNEESGNSVKTTKAPAHKNVKDMSDEELQQRIRRLEMERRYKELTPEQVSAGKKFIQNVVLPKAQQTAVNIASDYATKKIKDYLGLSNDDPLKSLRKEVEKLNLEKQYADLKDVDTANLRREVQKKTLERQFDKLNED